MTDVTDTVRRTYNAYNARDLALPGLHPDVDWDNGEHEMLHGLEAVAEHWKEQWRIADARVRFDQWSGMVLRWFSM